MRDILDILSGELLMDADELRKFIMRAPYRYKKYRIPKREKGKYRDIAQPTKEIKILQRLAIYYIREILPIHNTAMAYQKGTSIKNNADRHKNNSYLLKMDFKKFFPSIKPDDLINLLTDNGYEVSSLNKTILANLFFYKIRSNSPLRLSIGAPSSPFISNAVMFKFDTLISETCLGLGIEYTRYADDLTFTTNEKNILFDVPKIIKKTKSQLVYPALVINKDKTVFSSKRYNRHVTGLVITNDGKISLGRSRKRYIKSLVHKYSLNLLDIDEFNKLKGLISFSCDVEPTFVESLYKKYGDNIMVKIIKGIG